MRLHCYLRLLYSLEGPDNLTLPQHPPGERRFNCVSMGVVLGSGPKDPKGYWAGSSAPALPSIGGSCRATAEARACSLSTAGGSTPSWLRSLAHTVL